MSRVPLSDLPESCSKSRPSLLGRALVQLCCLVAIGYFGIAGQHSEFAKVVDDSIGRYLEQRDAAVQFKMLCPPAQSCLFGP